MNHGAHVSRRVDRWVISYLFHFSTTNDTQIMSPDSITSAQVVHMNLLFHFQSTCTAKKAPENVHLLGVEIRSPPTLLSEYSRRMRPCSHLCSFCLDSRQMCFSYVPSRWRDKSATSCLQDARSEMRSDLRDIWSKVEGSFSDVSKLIFRHKIRVGKFSLESGHIVASELQFFLAASELPIFFVWQVLLIMHFCNTFFRKRWKVRHLFSWLTPTVHSALLETFFSEL